MAADQITKYLAELYLSSVPPIVIIEGLLDLNFVRNKGAAFGLLANLSPAVRVPLFSFVTALAVYLLWRFFIRGPASSGWITAAVSLLFGGALGNFIDRIRTGEVVDFIDLHVGPYHWPAFNLADSAITVGAAILLLRALRR